MASSWLVLVMCAGIALLGCGSRTGLGDTTSASNDGIPNNGAGRDDDTELGDRPSGDGRDGAEGDDGASPHARPAPLSCSMIRDASWFADGSKLHVDDDAGCEGATPCFSSLSAAVGGASHGDTIVVLPGTYRGALVRQADELGALRIVSREGPEVTTITGDCIAIHGEDHVPGEIWIEGFTFHTCGAATSVVNDGWAIAVSTRSAVDVRIEGNAFAAHGGRGGVGIWSSFVGVHVGAVIARNTFAELRGEAALQVDLPAHEDEDYCIRVENNLFVHNDVAIDFFYTPFKEPRAQFEVVNNTIAENRVGLKLSNPTGRHLLANNIFFANESDLPLTAELADLVVHHNLIESGQFSGLEGNFAADPLFDDGFRLSADSPALERGDPTRAPLFDLDGAERGAEPALGAYQGPADRTTVRDPLCGDGFASFGTVDTPAGLVVAFEACDDGNLDDGDGCSSQCLLEPSASTGLISRVSTSLCVVRADETLSCWGSEVKEPPPGAFEQVAVSAYHACGLKSDGQVACWSRSRPTFTPAETFVQIASGSGQTCGVLDDGDIMCWDDREITLTKAGPFVRVDANQRVCAIDAQGTATCWDPNVDSPIKLDGTLLQTFPTRGGGCALTREARIVCDRNDPSSSTKAPAAALTRAAIASSGGVGLRPDGRIVVWGSGALSTPLPDRTFIDVVPGVVPGVGHGGCGLTADRRVYCWDGRYDLPQE
jgi:cysteine-rich repeat protein